MAQVAECIEDIPLEDNEKIVGFARQFAIDLVVVGPEAPLTCGLVDALEEAGISAFGPSRADAELEGSKSFAKMMMDKYHIPTAKFKVFTEAEEARAYVKEQGTPIVIKAEYYFSYKIWPLFAVIGTALLVSTLFMDGLFANILSVLGITCLWCIIELFHQKKRVEKGWFPRNPNRKNKE
jgi:hypothetical protein